MLFAQLQRMFVHSAVTGRLSVCVTRFRFGFLCDCRYPGARDRRGTSQVRLRQVLSLLQRLVATIDLEFWLLLHLCVSQSIRLEKRKCVMKILKLLGGIDSAMAALSLLDLSPYGCRLYRTLTTSLRPFFNGQYTSCERVIVV